MSEQLRNPSQPLTERIRHALATGHWLIIALLTAIFALFGGLILAFGGPLVGVALVIGLIGAGLVLQNIELGLWATFGVICGLPFATLPIDIGVTPTFLDLALGAFVGVWLLRIVTGQQRRIITSPITIPLIVFLIIAIFAFIFGLQNGPFTTTLVRRFAELLLSIGTVLIIVDYCRDWKRLERVVIVALLGGGLASVLAISLWLLPDELANDILNFLVRLGYPGGWVIRYIEENPALSERAVGTSVDPNALGGLITMFGALALPQAVAKKPIVKRWLAVSITLLIFVAILLTFSRGAFLALAAGLGYVAVLRYRKLIPVAIAAVAMLFVLPFTQEYVVRLVQGLSFFNYNNTDLASQMRLGEFRDAWTLISRYPVFGVGFAGSPDIDLYLGVANVYLSIGQQMGFIGLASFFAIIGVTFGYAFFNRATFKQDERKDPVWLGLHAAVVSGLAAGLFDHYLFNTEFHHTVTAFWLLLGLAVASTHLVSRQVV
ncbi:MAG: O-antigen ligase family protein [Candidatus Promineifilaceae bacterium]